MKSITAAIGILKVIKRLPSSLNGNPRWAINIDGWDCHTKPDSAYGYEVENLDGKLVLATIGTHYGVPTLNTLERI
jgi:mRNA-degrading endonuclease YafQ of YafQ-DinJ toxin-antitoxin module